MDAAWCEMTLDSQPEAVSMLSWICHQLLNTGITAASVQMTFSCAEMLWSTMMTTRSVFGYSASKGDSETGHDRYLLIDEKRKQPPAWPGGQLPFFTTSLALLRSESLS